MTSDEDFFSQVVQESVELSPKFPFLGGLRRASGRSFPPTKKSGKSFPADS